MKAEATSTQLNLLLFSAADAGCVPLARRVLEAGASLEARDRFGAMALARAARSGHAALVEFFLAQGAAIDARNLEGTTALYAASENERQATVAALLAKRADPNLPAPRASRRLPLRLSKATAASWTCSSPAAPIRM